MGKNLKFFLNQVSYLFPFSFFSQGSLEVPFHWTTRPGDHPGRRDGTRLRHGCGDPRSG